MIKATIPFLLLALFACSNSDNDPDPGKEPGPAPGEVVTYGNESLVAVDPAGKEIAFDYRARATKRSASSTSSGWAPTATTQATISAATSSRRRPRTPGRLTTSVNWKKATAIRPTFLSVPEAPCTIGASPIWITTSPTTRG